MPQLSSISPPQTAGAFFIGFSMGEIHRCLTRQVPLCLLTVMGPPRSSSWENQLVNSWLTQRTIHLNWIFLLRTNPPQWWPWLLVLTGYFTGFIHDYTFYKWLVGGFKHFYFHFIYGIIDPSLTFTPSFFKMGTLHHQPDYHPIINHY